MHNTLMSITEATDLINQGVPILIAGDEAALTQLPKGAWIGGTTAYFMTADGGKQDRENVFVTSFPQASNHKLRFVPEEILDSLTQARFAHGATMILIPAFSKAHHRFALDGMGFEDIFAQPLMGWIAGVHLDEIDSRAPKVFDGATGTAHSDGAVLLHLQLPADLQAEIDIVNLFEQDKTGPKILFPADGFNATMALVDGKEVNFADYLVGEGIDTRLPLVADYAGAMINVSVQAIEDSKVAFYAPVVEGVEYRIARAPGDYAEVFRSQVGDSQAAEISCNCILNYLYGALEGKTTGNYTGPVTFGEIAYMLLNQTMVRLQTKAAEQSDAA